MDGAGMKIVALIGGILIALSDAAQAWKIYSTKSAKDVSYGWQILLACGHVLYLFYTLRYGLWPVYTYQFMDLTFLTTMIALKVYFDRKDEKARKMVTSPSMQDMLSHEDTSPSQSSSELSRFGSEDSLPRLPGKDSSDEESNSP